MRHPIDPRFTEGDKQSRLKALREEKEKEIREWLERENRKIAKFL